MTQGHISHIVLHSVGC